MFLYLQVPIQPILPFCGRTYATTQACHAGRAQNHKLDVRCHSSQGHAVQQEGPDLSRLDSVLQQQWDHAANAHRGNIDVTPGSYKKAWWLCDQCPDGYLHSWEASIKARTLGTGCPQCCGRKVCKHNCLATKDPLVAAQWDYEANDSTPDSVVAQSNQPVGWLCDVCGHKWRVAPSRRVCKNRSGCPNCSGQRVKTKKRTTHPTFAKCQDPRGKALLGEWDHERNAPQGNQPCNTTMKSSKRIYWLCTKCPAGQQHSWSAQPSDRTKPARPGCPFCAGQAACKCNSLQALCPDVAAEWDYAKNQGQPSNYTASSHHLAWWVSPKRGTWQQTINSRTKHAQKGSTKGPAKLKRVCERHKS